MIAQKPTFSDSITAVPETVSVPLLKLDLGCGPNPAEGFEGVDQYPFGGKVKHVVDLRGPWPWGDNTVGEVHSSHFIEHLEMDERTHFANELYRVLAPPSYDAAGKPVSGIARLIAPHCFSNRAYGDPTHKWPPVSEMWGWYLDRNWRAANAPHTDAEYNPKGFNCDFLFEAVFTMHGHLLPRSEDYRQHALAFWKEAAQDIVFTLRKR